MANLGIDVGTDLKLAADAITLNGETAYRQAIAEIHANVFSARKVVAAAGTAALAADLTGYTLEAEIASSTSADPLATAPTVTVNSATQFEVAFTAASASGITPGTYVLSAYRTGSGLRTELARVVVVVTATAFAP